MVVTPIYALYNLIKVFIDEKENLIQKRKNNE